MTGEESLRTEAWQTRSEEIERLREQLHQATLQREKTEADLRSSLADLARIGLEWRETLDALDDLVLLVDRKGHILRVNRTAESWGLGSVQELPQSDFHDTLHPSCEAADCYLAEAHRGLEELPPADGFPQSAVIEIEDRQLGKHVALKIRRIDPAAGPDRTLFAVLVLRDLTRHRHLQTALARRQQLETMTRLVRGLAHEIGNPLATVRTSVEVLARNFDRFSRDKKGAYLQRILTAADRIQTELESILRQDSEPITRLVAVPVVPLCAGLVARFGDEMRRRGLRYDLRWPREDALLIHADAEAVETVLAITINNAMDACGKGGRVDVTVQSDSRSVCLEIRDNGAGIRQADLERIFQPFFTSKPGGRGISMLRAQHLMEQMNGRIEVDSTFGEGTSVSLFFQHVATPEVEGLGGRPARASDPHDGSV